MLNIRNLKIDPTSLGEKMLLVDITPAYEYKDGRRLDTVTGTAISSPCRNTVWKNWA